MSADIDQKRGGKTFKKIEGGWKEDWKKGLRKETKAR